VIKSFPVRFAGSLAAVIGLSVALYLGGVIQVYILGWILGLIEAI
jgi:hypothetical protein